MTSSFRKQGNDKATEMDSANNQPKDSWRLYFGRTPGGIPAVRVVKKDFRSPDPDDSSEDETGKTTVK